MKDVTVASYLFYSARNGTPDLSHGKLVLYLLGHRAWCILYIIHMIYYYIRNKRTCLLQRARTHVYYIYYIAIISTTYYITYIYLHGLYIYIYIYMYDIDN